MAAPPLLFRNRGEAKTANKNSHAGWNPGTAIRESGITSGGKEPLELMEEK